MFLIFITLIFTKFNADKDGNRQSVDLVICMGGDGTLLHVSSLFQVSIKN